MKEGVKNVCSAEKATEKYDQDGVANSLCKIRQFAHLCFGFSVVVANIIIPIKPAVVEILVLIYAYKKLSHLTAAL